MDLLVLMNIVKSVTQKGDKILQTFKDSFVDNKALKMLKSLLFDDKILRLRLIACYLWIVSGVMTKSLPGYISAFASLLFIIALLSEVKNKKVQ